MNKCGPSILIVDDEPAHLLITKRAVVQLLPGVRLFQAASVGEARLVMQQEVQLDLAIIDINLGMDSGLSLLPDLCGPAGKTRTLVVSTSDEQSDIRESYDLGAHCYVTKSSSPEQYKRDLLGALKFFLAR